MFELILQQAIIPGLLTVYTFLATRKKYRQEVTAAGIQNLKEVILAYKELIEDLKKELAETKEQLVSTKEQLAQMEKHLSEVQEQLRQINKNDE